MDDMQKLERARSYLDLLSKGIDPIGGEAVPHDDILINEKLKEIFSYVCIILQEVIDNNGRVVNIVEKQAFFFSEDKKRDILLSKEPITSTDFVRKLNLYIDRNKMHAITSAPIYKWLVQNKYLEEEKIPVKSFKNIRKLTELSQEFGLSVRKVVVQTTGEVKEEFVFSKEAQEFILKNINEIVNPQKEIDILEL